MVVGLVAYLLPNWRDLQMTLAILLGLLLGLYFVLPESPRWLIATGRYKKAKKVGQVNACFDIIDDLLAIIGTGQRC